MSHHYLLSIALLASSSITTQAAAPSGSSCLMWYKKPADAYGLKSPLKSWTVENQSYYNKVNPDKAWEQYALPLGNGFLGAMIYGGAARERVQLNLHSLWTGGPGSPGWTSHQNKPDTHKTLSEIQKTLIAGDKKKAQSMSSQNLHALGDDDVEVNRHRFGRSQTFGELTIETGHDDQKVSGYRRELDLSSGIHTVRYSYADASFTRTSFCSYPDRCLVLHFEADKPGQQNLTLAVASPHAVKTTSEKGVLVVNGIVKNNGLKLDLRIGILTKGGKTTVDSKGIHITQADNVTLVLVGGTDYAQKWPTFRGADPKAKNKKLLAKAMNLGFAKLKKRHLTDHRNLHGRVAVDWGSTPAKIRKLPTNERMKRNKKTPDPDLEELYFQFGRYLLMGSSRPGGLPANLQGIWCNETIPAWNSDYHFNINMQMNYWPSGPCNLLECQKPLIGYINSLRKPGAETARAYFDAAGWTANLSGNIWGSTIPSASNKGPMFWRWFPLAGAWMSTHAWEQYAFGLDKKELRQDS